MIRGAFVSLVERGWGAGKVPRFDVLADETTLEASVASIELVGFGRGDCVVFIIRVVEIVKIIEILLGES
jgi:hypothetical protein